ncbi:hypothetical protein ACJX0J_023299, partial [Zea mays]
MNILRQDKRFDPVTMQELHGKVTKIMNLLQIFKTGKQYNEKHFKTGKQYNEKHFKTGKRKKIFSDYTKA